LTSISFVTLGLTLIQTTIRQGLAEQALQRGLNTENAVAKYEAHKEIIESCNERMIYLPYFLHAYNKRHTELRKRDFLINNNFRSEEHLYQSDKVRLINMYRKILVNITAASIKWSTSEIVYDKTGRIITLDEYRMRRIRNSVFVSLLSMLGVTFLATGLFFSPSTEPLWQKFVKLFTYILSIAISSIFSVVKEYEKGAFTVPNELDEINQIWYEFKVWEVPEWVVEEIEKLNEDTEVTDEQEANVYGGTNLSSKQKESKNIQRIESDTIIPVLNIRSSVLSNDDRELCG
jgi:hypothetical protein